MLPRTAKRIAPQVSCLPTYESMPELEDPLREYRAGFDIVGMHPVGRPRRTGRVIEFDVVKVRASAFEDRAEG